MKEIKRYLDTRVGEYSFYLEELNSGYSYGVNENKQMPSAGCIKIPIGIALLKEVQSGRFNLNDQIKIDKDDMINGTRGIIHEFSEKEYSLRELLISMLIQSDNTAAKKIIDIVGINRINEIIREMGLKQTFLKAVTSEHKLKENDLENSSTSFELTRCYKMLHEKTFLNEEFSNLMLDILKKQQINSKIPFYMPKSEKHNIAHKGGSLDGIENDTAFLMLPKGNFMFTVMSNKLPNNVYGITTIARTGKMMWDIIEGSWK